MSLLQEVQRKQTWTRSGDLEQVITHVLITLLHKKCFRQHERSLGLHVALGVYDSERSHGIKNEGLRLFTEFSYGKIDTSQQYLAVMICKKNTTLDDQPAATLNSPPSYNEVLKTV